MRLDQSVICQSYNYNIYNYYNISVTILLCNRHRFLIRTFIKEGAKAAITKWGQYNIIISQWYTGWQEHIIMMKPHVEEVASTIILYTDVPM